MVDMTIPCDVFVRASKITFNVEFEAIRLENGLVIATSGQLLTVENVGGWLGVVNILPHPDLVKQCVEEAKYNGNVTIIYNEMLGYATAKTTFGYVHSGNLVSTQENRLSRWREVVGQCVEPAPVSVGAMFWDASIVSKLATVAPSGGLLFEETIDVNRPVLMRDKNDPNWCAFFHAFPKGETAAPATCPNWIK